MILQGRWEDAENYLSGFTKVMDNHYSTQIYFRLRKQKYIEALDRNDRKMALDILMKEFKVFAPRNEHIFKDLFQLLTIDNIRQFRTLTTCQDAYSARKILVNQLKSLIMGHPQLRGKLHLPPINHTLRHVINRYNLEQAPTQLPKRVEFSNIFEKNILFLRLTTLFKKQDYYVNFENALLALTSNGTHFYWRWPNYSTPREATQIFPGLRNDLTSANSGDLVSCFAISKWDLYLVSLSGGAVSLYDLITSKTMATFMPPPPMATCVAFYREDNNIVFIGMDDSSIVLYHRPDRQVLFKLYGHSKRVTSLAFSNTLDVLVSADLNAQIVVWSTRTWKKLRERKLEIQRQNVPEILSETQIQFHPNEKQFLVVNNSHLAIYEATELECVTKWNQEDLVVITHATFSSNGSRVFVSFVDGILAVFHSSNLYMQYRIHPSAYLPPTPSVSVYPTCIAADPKNPEMFTVGFNDGDAYVIGPPIGTKW